MRRVGGEKERVAVVAWRGRPRSPTSSPPAPARFSTMNGWPSCILQRRREHACRGVGHRARGERRENGDRARRIRIGCDMPMGRSPKRRPAAERRPRPYVVVSSQPYPCPSLFVSLPTRILSAAQDTPGKQGAPMQIRRLLFAATLAAAGLSSAAAQAQVQDVAAVGGRARDRAVCGGRPGRCAGAADERAARRADQGHVHPGEPRRRGRHHRRPGRWRRRRRTGRRLLFTTSSHLDRAERSIRTCRSIRCSSPRSA